MQTVKHTIVATTENTVTVRASGVLSPSAVMVLPISEKTYREQWRVWRREGVLIQSAFPMLSPDEREFLMTGITPEVWDVALEQCEPDPVEHDAMLYGFMTGGRRFFGEGRDTDWVVKFSLLSAESKQRVSWNVGLDPEEYFEQGLLFVLYEPDLVTDIIVTSDAEFEVWKYATEKFDTIAASNPVLKDNKDVRVFQFEQFKTEARNGQC